MDIEKRHRDRLVVLNALYELTEGRPKMGRTRYEQLPEPTGLELSDVEKALEWLVAEGLAEWLALGGVIGITHYGVKEVETASRGQSTDHFAATTINIVNAQTIHGGVHQAGTMQLSPSDAEVIRSLVETIREELQQAGEDREVIEAQLRTVESELNREAPRSSVLKGSLGILRDLTVGFMASGAWSQASHLL